MILVTFDNIIPLGEKLIMYDVLLAFLLKSRDALFVCLVLPPVDRREYSQACFSPDSCSHFLGFLYRTENCSLPCLGNLGEEPVLYRIPFGAIWWIMGNSDVNANVVRQSHKTILEEPSPCGVGSTAIAKDKYGLRVWVDMPKGLLPILTYAVTGELGCVMAHSECHVARILRDVIYAMRYNLSLSKRLIVMVKGFHDIQGVRTAVVPPKVADNLLLLCVDADDGLPCSNLLLTQLLYPGELGIPVLAFRHRDGFQGLTPRISFGFYYLPDSEEADIYVIILLVSTLYLSGAEPKPFRVSVLWETCIAVLNDLRKEFHILGMLDEDALPSSTRFAYPAFFRMHLFLEFVHSSVYGLPVCRDCLANKTHAVPAIPLGDDGKEFSALALVHIFEKFHFIFRNHICWGVRTSHNYLVTSYKGTNISADIKI